MTFLAYLVVVLGGPVVLTIVVLFVGLLLALALVWAPLKLRVVFASSIAGTLGALAVAAFGYWAFGVIAGPSAGSTHPFIAIAVALLIPTVNDIGKAKQIREAASALPTGLEDETAPQRIGLPAQVAGYAAGILLLVGWLALRAAA